MTEKFKKFLEEKGISNEDYNKMEVDKLAGVQQEYFESITKDVDEALKKKASKADMEAAVKEGVKDIEETLKTQGTVLEGIRNGGLNKNSVESDVHKFLADNKEEISKLMTAGSGVIKMTVKAPENITTGNATQVGTVPNLVGVQQAPPSNINLRAALLMERMTILNTSVAAYPYTEVVPKEGDFTFLAEGAVKPQIDFTIETRYATPYKAAAWQRLTTESIQDIAGLQSIATDFLQKKHSLRKQKGALFGDGTGNNPEGAQTIGRAFVAGGMANQLPAASANIMDILNACATDIYNTHNYEDEDSYMPNVAVIDPVDFFLQFVAAKDGDGRPLYPTASLFNFVDIGGMLIIPERDITAGNVLVCDMSKYNLTNYIPYSVSVGWVNDDFIKNQFVILGESRFHAFVKNLDRQAFIYDSIATVKAAIEAP